MRKKLLAVKEISKDYRERRRSHNGPNKSVKFENPRPDMLAKVWHVDTTSLVNAPTKARIPVPKKQLFNQIRYAVKTGERVPFQFMLLTGTRTYGKKVEVIYGVPVSSWLEHQKTETVEAAISNEIIKIDSPEMNWLYGVFERCETSGIISTLNEIFSPEFYDITVTTTSNKYQSQTIRFLLAHRFAEFEPGMNFLCRFGSPLLLFGNQHNYVELINKTQIPSLVENLQVNQLLVRELLLHMTATETATELVASFLKAGRGDIVIGALIELTTMRASLPTRSVERINSLLLTVREYLADTDKELVDIPLEWLQQVL